MFVRLALESDFDAIVEMSRENFESTRSEVGFEEYEVRETLYGYLDRADPTIFVCEGENRSIVGFVVCSLSGYRWVSGLCVIQEVLYVRPEHRGTRAAVLLMKQLISWAKSVGAREIQGGNDNRFNSERTAKFLEHFGFERVGYHMRKGLV